MDLASATDTVDAAFETFGEEAFYGDPGVEPATACVVIPWTPRSERQRSGFMIDGVGIAEASEYILVRVAEVAQPQALGAFRLEQAGTLYRIGEDAPLHHDSRRIVWRCRAVVEQG